MDATRQKKKEKEEESKARCNKTFFGCNSRFGVVGCLAGCLYPSLRPPLTFADTEESSQGWSAKGRSTKGLKPIPDQQMSD